MRFKSVFISIAIGATLGAVAIVTTAAAAPTGQAITRCGQNIEDGEAYLARDLTCSVGFNLVPNTGEEYPGRNVSVDLRGHRLSGNGSGTAFLVDTYPGFSNLKVQNGRIDHWGAGIVGIFTTVSVTKVQLLNNGRAMVCDEESCQATDSLIKNNEVGITARDDTVEATRTTFIGNGLAAEATGALSQGIYTDNTFTGNKIAVRYGDTLSGVTARHNIFTANGIGILGRDLGDDDNDYSSATISENTFIANGDGIYLTVRGPEGIATVARNLAVKNKRYGIYAAGATDGGGNHAALNGRPCFGVVCGRHQS